MNTNTVISLPVSTDLSGKEHLAVTLGSTGLALAGAGDRIIGTLLQGNVKRDDGGSVVGMAATVFLSAGNGVHFVTVGNSTAISTGDELEQGAAGVYNKRVARTGGTAAAATDLITLTAHGFAAGQAIVFTTLTTGTGLTVGSTYYVIATGLTANVFSVSTTPGGTAVDLTGSDYTVVAAIPAAVGVAIDSNPATSAGSIFRALLFQQPGSVSTGVGNGTTGTGLSVNQTSPTLVTPVLGVATGTSLAVTAGLTSSGPTGAGIGYATGAGGAVTQATNRTTGVTLNTLTGTITTNNASLAAEAAAEFTVTNSTVAIGDTVVASIQSGSNSGNTDILISTVAAGSFKIKVINNNAAAGTAETGAILINYAVIKAVSS